MDQNNEKQPQWYENFLNEYDYHSPKTGDIIDGTIISIEGEGFLVDIGLKRDAVVQTKDLSKLEENYVSSLKVGDVVTVFILGQAEGDKELQVSISKGIEYASWKKAEKIMGENTIVNLEVVGHNRGGLVLKFDNLRGFLPFSLVPEIQSIRNPKHAERVKKNLMGSTIQVKVIEVAQYRNRLIFSALAAQEEKRSERLKELKKGQIIKGRVSSIVDFGVFVDLDGIDGLVHISQIDWKKVKHPNEILKVDDEIDVKIISIDVEKQRVSLSRKAVLPSPWDTIGETLEAGDYIEGKVTRQVDFGAFVRLPYGIEGLIHISQVGYSSSQDPKTAIKPGETVLLKVLEVNPEKKRVALSMRQVPLEKQIAWAMEDVSKEFDSFSQEISQDDADQNDTSNTELEIESEETNNISSDNQDL